MRSEDTYPQGAQSLAVKKKSQRVYFRRFLPIMMTFKQPEASLVCLFSIRFRRSRLWWKTALCSDNCARITLGGRPQQAADDFAGTQFYRCKWGSGWDNLERLPALKSWDSAPKLGVLSHTQLEAIINLNSGTGRSRGSGTTFCLVLQTSQCWCTVGI